MRYFLILFLFITSTAHAEMWVCEEAQKLRRLEGDGFKLGLTGKNNSNILPNCIEATRQEYADAGLSGKKLDKSVVTGNRIVDMTQAEKDAIAQAEADALAQAEAARLLALDDSITSVDVTGTKLQKVETAINNIGNLNDAKNFLKRLVRYIASQ